MKSLRTCPGQITSLLGAGVIALGVACGGADALGPHSSKVLRVISGGSGQDSAFGRLVTPLVIEVHEPSGGLAPAGTTLRLQTLSHDSAYNPGGEFFGVREFFPVPELFIRSPGDQDFSAGTIDRQTDSLGRVVVQVRLGAEAGTARLRVSAPTLGATDTVRYTAVPGNPVDMALTPNYVGVIIGDSLTFRGGVLDRSGNLRADPVTWTVTPNTIAISPTGVVTGTQLGQFTVTMTSPVFRVPFTKTANLIVLPRARLAVWRSDALGMLDVDGNNGRRLATVQSYLPLVAPRWMADGGAVIYSTLVGDQQHLAITDTLGRTRLFPSSALPAGSQETAAAPSSDGQWVVFTVTGPQCGTGAVCLYRAQADGSSPELIGSFPPAVVDVSPDGSRVVLAEETGTELLAIASRVRTSLGLRSDYAAWSPDGTQIALASGGQILLVDLNGSVRRTIRPSIAVQGPISWTRDGNYLAGSAFPGAALYDARTGTELPVPATIGATAVTVR